jgi:hypothetical protein
LFPAGCDGYGYQSSEATEIHDPVGLGPELKFLISIYRPLEMLRNLVFNVTGELL